MKPKLKKLSEMSRPQRRTYRQFRQSGMSIREAKRLALMNYNQLGSELSRQLRALGERRRQMQQQAVS